MTAREPPRVDDQKHGARSRLMQFIWWLVRVDPEISRVARRSIAFR